MKTQQQRDTPMKYILFIALSLSLTSCQLQRSQPTSTTSTTSLSDDLDYRIKTELPIATNKQKEIILNHRYFIISYNPTHKQANYVQYISSKENLIGKAARKSNFTADPQLILKDPHNYTKPNDLKFSRDAYVKGHLAPSADFRFSKEARDLTNIMSNVSPQKKNFNNKPWKQLEEKVRAWTCGEERVVILTGPILKPDLKKLKSGISVPNHYYKAILDLSPPMKTVAFIYHQDDPSKTKLSERAVSIEELEKKIGYKVFPFLEDAKINTTYDLKSWKEARCKLGS